MRLRLGLLRDTGSSSSSERQSTKDSAEEQAKKKPDEPNTKIKDKERDEKKVAVKPRIRPLSEAKAIDAGANFISEAFLFMVAGGLIVLESWRSRRRENTRREDVADRLAALEESERNARRAVVALEKEILALESGKKPITGRKQVRILPSELWKIEEAEDGPQANKKMGWWAWLGSFTRTRRSAGDDPPKNPPSAPVPAKRPGDDPSKTPTVGPVPIASKAEKTVTPPLPVVSASPQ